MTIHESNMAYIYGALVTAVEYWNQGADAKMLLHDLELLIQADENGVNLVTEPEKVDTKKL